MDAISSISFGGKTKRHKYYKNCSVSGIELYIYLFIYLFIYHISPNSMLNIVIILLIINNLFINIFQAMLFTS